jgi:hypothetical protein
MARAASPPQGCERVTVIRRRWSSCRQALRWGGSLWGCGRRVPGKLEQDPGALREDREDHLGDDQEEERSVAGSAGPLRSRLQQLPAREALIARHRPGEADTGNEDYQPAGEDRDHDGRREITFGRRSGRCTRAGVIVKAIVPTVAAARSKFGEATAATTSACQSGPFLPTPRSDRSRQR